MSLAAATAGYISMELVGCMVQIVGIVHYNLIYALFLRVSLRSLDRVPEGPPTSQPQNKRYIGTVKAILEG